VVAELRTALPREAIVAADITRTGYAMLPHFPAYGPRTFLHSCGFIAMGHAFPAALGAQVAFPERTVVAVAGDGGFLMTAEELAVAVQEALPVVAIVMNDGALGGIRLLQERDPGARPFGVLLRNPDFAAFARAFGALGFTVGKRADFLPALREALAARRPAVLDVTAPPLET
jgi:acetolactate synthase-1/2/3 large subunit